MKSIVKHISELREYHARFLTTKIYRIIQTDEVLLKSFEYSPIDEDYSEIIFRPSIGMGHETWFTFNKIEQIAESGFIDYHKNMWIDEFSYIFNTDLDLEISQVTLYSEDGLSAFLYAFKRSKEILTVELRVTDFKRFHMKVEFSNPLFIHAYN